MIKSKKRVIILIVIFSVLAVIVITISGMLDNKKKEIRLYDSYADVIEDYSFILGCQNTVKCQVTESGDYSRKYVYNTYYDGDDKVIFQYGLFQDSYKYEKHELFKGINLVKPFPEAALPNHAETHMEFRHYLSKVESDIVFDPDNSHERIALSFNRSISYKELTEYNANFDNLGYAVKFCWVDTYLPSEVTASSKYATGRPVPQTVSGYEKYAEYDTAYGFLIYDHDYLNKAEFDEPVKRFIDIITAHHDDNFMSEELSSISEELLKKDQLSMDSLEIIGIILEKKDGKQFSIDEAQSIQDNDELITFVYS